MQDYVDYPTHLLISGAGKFTAGINLVDSSVTSAVSAYNIQKMNARASAYGVVAANNPGINFSLYMIRWDGSTDLETNCNTQLNSSWHAQVAVKGNFFSQTFDGNDFTGYSTVIADQTNFDTYKAQGTQWWIACSTLSTFSKTSATGTGSANYVSKWNSTSGLASSSIYDNGNVGIGTTSPQAKLDINGFMRMSTNAAAPAACTAMINGSIALTSLFTTCACKGATTTWVSTVNGTTACIWM